MITRDIIDLAIQSWLATATGKQVGYYDAPTDPVLPYAILYPGSGTADLGAWSQPDEDNSLTYQITAVGESPKQAQWLASKIHSAFVDRSGAGFASTITISGVSVQWRSTDMLGPVTPSGEDLYMVQNIYRVRLGV